MAITVAARKRALLLHYAGEHVNDIFETLLDTGEDKDFKTAVEKLTAYFISKRKIVFETYTYRQTKQRLGETLDQFHTRLRQLASTCEFNDAGKEIYAQIVQNCLSYSLRRRALRTSRALSQLLDLGRSFETGEQQAAGIEGQQNTTNEIN